MKIRTALVALVALAALATLAAPAPSASAGVWDPDPVGNGPGLGPPTSTSRGGQGIPCWNNMGVYKGTPVFDPYYYGCTGIYPVGGPAVFFNGFEVWRFYGYRDPATLKPTRILFSTVSSITNGSLGVVNSGGYQVAAPHPLDFMPAPSWGAPGTFKDRVEVGINGAQMMINGSKHQVPNEPFWKLGAGDCASVTTSYMNDTVRSTDPDIQRAALTRVKDLYTSAKKRVGAKMAATMANLSAPPARPEDVNSYLAVWDDGIPCSSVLEYAARPTDTEQPQVVTCWKPTMRLGVPYSSNRNTPFSPNRYGWRSGDVRYDGTTPPPNDFALQRQWILFDRTMRGPWGAWQPYLLENPEWFPGRDANLAAWVASSTAICQEDTALVNGDGSTIDVTETITSPSAEVVIERTGDTALRVGGAARPASAATSTRLVCPTPGCRASDPAVPPTELRSSSHNLRVTGLEGYKACRSATEVNCDYYVAESSGSSSERTNKVWLYRATQGPERIRFSVTDATATVVRHTVVRRWECPRNWGGKYEKCTLRSSTSSETVEQVAPSTPGDLTAIVVAATNDPSRRR